MDTPNNGGPLEPNASNTIRRLRGGPDDKRQQALRAVRQYEPIMHQQIQRLCHDYKPPFGGRLWGYSRTKIFAAAAQATVPFTASLGRPFTDTETEAFTKHYLYGIEVAVSWKWFMASMAAYMTYRGRKTLRFPFIQPSQTGMFNPTGRPYMRNMWHTARYAAYYMTYWILCEPFIDLSRNITCFMSMNKDPRLATVMLHAREAAPDFLSGLVTTGQDSDRNSQHNDMWKPDQSNRPAFKSGDDADSIPARAQAAWDKYRQPEPSEIDPQSEPWDALPDGTSQDQQRDPVSQGGSAWDRIRNQSQNQDHQQGQQTWEAPQATGEWAGNDDASPQSRGPKNSSTFSSSDQEAAAAKSQAQKEFDELLDRERRGEENERSSWGGRR